LFLDIDGVLNTPAFIAGLDASATSSDFIDKSKVLLLNRIVQSFPGVTGSSLVVVLSSDWRHSFSAAEMTKNLKKFGFMGEVSSCTAKSTRRRFDQISDWLQENADPDDDFVVLDDNDVFVHLRGMRAFDALANAHMFLTDEKIGLTDEIVDRIIKRSSVK
jgi:hypothetical protein